ncbi:hypothetical protein Asp14428_41790 [Actinoplanes sp. NBRC 14428]|nr:hypothetical protein Asp14428_41790 [Actinoplanes sp. NBRC 14428]
MSADMSYPNDDSIRVSGVLDRWNTEHGKPAGWIQDLIKRVEATDDTTPQQSARGSGGGVDLSGFSDEEKNAWNWYRNDVVNNWSAVKADWEKRSADKSNVEYDHNPNDGNDYGLNKGPGFTPPSVHEWSDSAKQGNGVAVNTQALRHFAKQLEAIEPEGAGSLTLKARSALEKVDIRPGGFAKAELLRRKIQGTNEGNNNSEDDGLRGDTMKLMRTVHQAIFNLRTSLVQIANEYDSGEKLNKMTGEQLAEAMETAWAEIASLKNVGNTESHNLGKGTPDPKLT